jgi:ubiquinone/menaquinone biosynthesis C-methylase UbiE
VVVEPCSVEARVTGIDYDQAAAAYRSGRTLPPDILEAWRQAVMPHVGVGGRVLDVGAGTGQFLRPLAEWLDARVVGVEPSAGMRAQAQSVVDGRTTALVAGRAEALPLSPASVDVAWLSTVVHQFDDVGRAVDELRRVVRPAGRVLVRGFLSDTPLTGLFARFPGSERSAATFPSSAAVLAAFEGGGFTTVAASNVVETWRFDVDRWRERVRALRHVDSWLRPLTDDEVAAGIAAVEQLADGSRAPLVSESQLSLLVLAG